MVQLSTKDMQAALEVVHTIFLRCEEDGIPEPLVEIARTGSGELNVAVRWYPTIYRHHSPVDSAGIEETFGFTFKDKNVADNVSYEGLILDGSTHTEFTIYKASEGHHE